MTYFKAVDNLMCLQCGWQPIKKEKVKQRTTEIVCKIFMGSVESSVPKDVEEQIFPIAHVPTRTEQREQRIKDREFGNYDDIKPMLRKVGGTMIKQEEHLPTTSVNDKQTLSRQEPDQQRESRNTAQGRYWTWH